MKSIYAPVWLILSCQIVAIGSTILDFDSWKNVPTLNSYNYATRNSLPSDETHVWGIPGKGTEKELGTSFDCQQILEAAERDGHKLIDGVDGALSECESNECLLAVIHSTMNFVATDDFHFFRYDAGEGTWSHKAGRHDAAIVIDEHGVNINFPHNAEAHLGVAYSSTRFCGYLCSIIPALGEDDEPNGSAEMEPKVCADEISDDEEFYRFALLGTGVQGRFSHELKRDSFTNMLPETEKDTPLTDPTFTFDPAKTFLGFEFCIGNDSTRRHVIIIDDKVVFIQESTGLRSTYIDAKYLCSFLQGELSVLFTDDSKEDWDSLAYGIFGHDKTGGQLRSDYQTALKSMADLHSASADPQLLSSQDIPIPVITEVVIPTTVKVAAPLLFLLQEEDMPEARGLDIEYIPGALKGRLSYSEDKVQGSVIGEMSFDAGGLPRVFGGFTLDANKRFECKTIQFPLSVYTWVCISINDDNYLYISGKHTTVAIPIDFETGPIGKVDVSSGRLKLLEEDCEEQVFRLFNKILCRAPTVVEYVFYNGRCEDENFVCLTDVYLLRTLPEHSDIEVSTNGECQRICNTVRNVIFTVVNSRMGFQEALEYCKKYAGNLASIRSKKEQDIIYQLLSRQDTIATDAFWMGMQLPFIFGDMFWTDRSQVYNYLNWDIEVDYEDTACGALSGTAHWQVHDCDEMHRFICQTEGGLSRAATPSERMLLERRTNRETDQPIAEDLIETPEVADDVPGVLSTNQGFKLTLPCGSAPVSVLFNQGTYVIHVKQGSVQDADMTWLVALRATTNGEEPKVYVSDRYENGDVADRLNRDTEIMEFAAPITAPITVDFDIPLPYCARGVVTFDISQKCEGLPGRPTGSYTEHTVGFDEDEQDCCAKCDENCVAWAFHWEDDICRTYTFYDTIDTFSEGWVHGMRDEFCKELLEALIGDIYCRQFGEESDFQVMILCQHEMTCAALEAHLLGEPEYDERKQCGLCPQQQELHYERGCVRSETSSCIFSMDASTYSTEGFSKSGADADADFERAIRVMASDIRPDPFIQRIVSQKTIAEEEPLDLGELKLLSVDIVSKEFSFSYFKGLLQLTFSFFVQVDPIFLQAHATANVAGKSIRLVNIQVSGTGNDNEACGEAHISFKLYKVKFCVVIDDDDQVTISGFVKQKFPKKKKNFGPDVIFKI